MQNSTRLMIASCIILALTAAPSQAVLNPFAPFEGSVEEAQQAARKEAIKAATEAVFARDAETRSSAVTKKKKTVAETQVEKAKKIEASLERRNENLPAVRNAPEGVTLYLGKTYIGDYYQGNRKFYLAAVVSVVNQTDAAIEIKEKDVTLILDGGEIPMRRVPGHLQSYSYYMSGKSIRLSELAKLKTLSLKPGETGELGLVIPDLGGVPSLPSLEVQVTFGEQTAILDVRRHELGRLNLTTEIMGPENSLALLTVHGRLNSVNWNVLMGEIESLLLQKGVARFVVTWDEKAPAPESQPQSWIQQVASYMNRNRGSSPQFLYPTGSLLELHWANLPMYRSEGASVPTSQGPRRIHKKTEQALAGAVASAIPTLTSRTIMQQIRQGDPRLRPVMLALGASSLGPGQLPFLFRYVKSEDQTLQHAAVTGLRHFNDPNAIELLKSLAQDTSRKDVRLTAIDSLAGSRFSSQQSALAELLGQKGFKIDGDVMTVLIRNPQSEWRDVIYGFLQTNPKEGAPEAVKALVTLGHPDLDKYVRKVLADPDEDVRNRAFSLFYNEKSPEIRSILVEHTLEHIRSKPPTSQMLTVISSARERRALPDLIKHLETTKSNVSSVISTMEAIGGNDAAEAIYRKYSTLKDYDQARALQSLYNLRSPRYMPLAKKALLSKNSSLINYACTGFRNDASDESVRILAEAMQKTDYSSAWSYITNSIGNIGTVYARQTMRKLQREVTNTSKRQYITNALTNMHSRTSASTALYKAQQFEREKKWKKALEIAEIGLKIDDDHPTLYQIAGSAHIELGDYEKGIAHLQEALQRNLDDTKAITKMGLALVRSGKVEEGVKRVEADIKRFETQWVYLYNTACVYGRAHEAAVANDADKALADKAPGFAKKAVELILAARKKGFSDEDLLKKDPDLATIRETDAYKESVEKNSGPPKRVKPKL